MIKQMIARRFFLQVLCAALGLFVVSTETATAQGVNEFRLVGEDVIRDPDMVILQYKISVRSRATLNVEGFGSKISVALHPRSNPARLVIALIESPGSGGRVRTLLRVESGTNKSSAPGEVTLEARKPLDFLTQLVVNKGDFILNQPVTIARFEEKNIQLNVVPSKD
jgi:hypothetical protein